MLPPENFTYADKFCIPHLQSDPSVNVGVHQDDPEKREEILMGGLGSLQGPEEGRDYIVCCRAYTASMAAAAGGIGIGIGIGIVSFVYWFEGFVYLIGIGIGIGTVSFE